MYKINLSVERDVSLVAFHGDLFGSLSPQIHCNLLCQNYLRMSGIKMNMQ